MTSEGGKRLTAAGAMLFALLTPRIAHAHEHLKRSEPAADSRSTVSPAALLLWFTERPELRLTSFSLRDSTGREIVLGPLERDTADALLVRAHILEHLVPGRYVLSWKATGSDGHPGQGTFTFTVAPPAVDTAEGVVPPMMPRFPAMRVDATMSSKMSATAGDPAYVIARMLSFVALLLVVGAVVFRYAVLPRAQFANDLRARIAGRVAAIGAAAACTLLLAALLRVNLQHRLMEDAGTGALSVRDIIFDTQWGFVWLMQIIAALLAVAGFMTARRRSSGWVVALISVVVLSVTPALAGHAAASQRLRSLAIVADAAHIVGGAGWIGSLFMLIVVATPIAALSRREDRWSQIASAVNAFSPTALACAGLLASTGVLAAWMHLGTLSALWTSTYGRVLLLKLGVLSGALGTGAYNWRRVRPVLGTETATRRLRRSAAVELLLGVLVVAVTAVLVATEPPMP